jgi:ribosomal protein S6E (S10)
MTTDSDVLRWIAQADQGEKPKKERKNKWKMAIHSWLGARKEGEWVRESVSTTVKRKYEKHTKGKGHTKKKPNIVKVQVEELVYLHDGYRPKLEGEKDTRKSFFWRGARVWRGQ